MIRSTKPLNTRQLTTGLRARLGTSQQTPAEPRPSGSGGCHSSRRFVSEPSESRPRVPHGESGFAVLLIFLMAAAIALMLYMQLPRVAFEAQRDKEQLLIDRGEQYKRGIQMYFVQFKKYPSKLEDLENTNNKRYLRRRGIAVRI